MLLKSAQECQRLLAGCRDAEAGWLERKKELIPRAEVLDWQRRFVEPLVSVIKMMPGEICSEVNPADPDHAAEVLERWMLSRFKIHYHDAIDAVDSLCKPTTFPTLDENHL